ncbi:MAG: YchJ family protein [Alcanivoracaceae bacterium]
MNHSEACLCGSGVAATQCCVRFHAGEAAPTPEALMRSRYTAYARNRMDYVRATWHPQTCPVDLPADTATCWRRLEIVDAGASGDEGYVHFRAVWQSGDQWGVLEERSRFLRQQGRWLYHSGQVGQISLTPGRNDPCPCGSGKKVKKCCG